MCKRCYKILESQAKFNVEEKQNEDINFEKHIYVFKYEGIIRDLLLKYKFQDKSYLYHTFTNFCLKNKKIFQILKSYDTIIPVPISRKRYRDRGYNQCYLLAKEFANKTGVELENRCIFKVKNAIEQSKLNKEERKKNIQGLYVLKNENKLKDKKVLLVDDIYTTGSTANECCKILRSAKPNKLDVLTIAKD